MAMGILVWSAQVRDLWGKYSLWVTSKGRVPGTGFVGLGLSVPTTFHPLDTVSLNICTVPSEETSSAKTLVLVQE